MNQCKFSIVIPLYNREVEITRALRSCLDQMSSEFEIVVVDDASTDGSVEAVRPLLGDGRIKLIRSDANRGEWAARARGVANADGEWIIWLDSDDEFCSGGLSLIASAVEQYGRQYQRLGLEFIYDSGGKSPKPYIDHPTTLDLAGYLRWYATVQRSDAVWVTKRNTFAEVPVPLGTGNDLMYAFTFNSTYRTILLPGTVAIVHTDVANRLTSIRRDYTATVQKRADGRRVECDALFQKFGPYMLEVCPEAHRRLSRMRVMTSILAGRRWAAFQNLLSHARHHLKAEVGSLLLLALAGARVTHWLNFYRQQRLLRQHSEGVI